MKYFWLKALHREHHPCKIGKQGIAKIIKLKQHQRNLSEEHFL
jgi:hypothetical protein